MVSSTGKCDLLNVVRPDGPARPRHLWLLVVLSATMAGCDRISRRAQHRGPPVVVDDTLLRYPDNSTLTLGVGSITFIGQLVAERAAPFVIVAVDGCSPCESPDAVLVHAPSAGRVTADDTRGVHPSPGRTYHASDGSTRSFSRLFWGHCLPQRPAGVISFRSEFGFADGEPLREVRITEVHGDSLLAWSTVPEVPTLVAVLQQVRARQCTELRSRETVSTP